MQNPPPHLSSQGTHNLPSSLACYILSVTRPSKRSSSSMIMGIKTRPESTSLPVSFPYMKSEVHYEEAIAHASKDGQGSSQTTDQSPASHRRVKYGGCLVLPFVMYTHLGVNTGLHPKLCRQPLPSGHPLSLARKTIQMWFNREHLQPLHSVGRGRGRGVPGLSQGYLVRLL